MWYAQKKRRSLRGLGDSGTPTAAEAEAILRRQGNKNPTPKDVNDLLEKFKQALPPQAGGGGPGGAGGGGKKGEANKPNIVLPGSRVYDEAIGIAPVYYGPGKLGPTGERDILSSVQNLSMLKYGGYDPRVQGGGLTQTNPNQVLYEGRWIAPELVALLQVTKGAPGLPIEQEYVETTARDAPVSDIMSQFAQRAMQRQWEVQRPTISTDEASISVPVTTSPGFSSQQAMSLQVPSGPQGEEPLEVQRPDRAPTSEERAEFVETMVGLNHYAYGRPRGMAALEAAVVTPPSTYEPYTYPGTPPPGPTPRPAPGPTPVPLTYPTVMTVPYVGGPVQFMITQPKKAEFLINLQSEIKRTEERALRDARARGERDKKLWEAEQAKIGQLRSAGNTYEIATIEQDRRRRLRDEEWAKSADRRILQSLYASTAQRFLEEEPSYVPPPVTEQPESRFWQWLRGAGRSTAVREAEAAGLSRDAAERVGDEYVRGGESAARSQGYREGIPLAWAAAKSAAGAAVAKLPSAGSIWDALKDAASSAAGDVSKSASALSAEAAALKQQAASAWEEKKQELGKSPTVVAAIARMEVAKVFDSLKVTDADVEASRARWGAFTSSSADRMLMNFVRKLDDLKRQLPAGASDSLDKLSLGVKAKSIAMLIPEIAKAEDIHEGETDPEEARAKLNRFQYVLNTVLANIQLVAEQAAVRFAFEQQGITPPVLKPPAFASLPAPIMIAEAPRAPWEQGELPGPAPRASAIRAAEAAMARARAVAQHAEADVRAAQERTAEPFRFPQGVVLEAASRELPELGFRRRPVRGQAEVTVGTQAPVQRAIGRATVEVLTDAQAQGISTMERLGQAAANALTGGVSAPPTSAQVRLQRVEQRLRETAGEAGTDFTIDQERSRLFAERGRLQRIGR